MTDTGDESAVDRFEAAIDAVVAAADMPYVQIAKSIDGMTRQTLARNLNHQQFPSWDTLSKILVALREDPAKYKRLWEHAALEKRRKRPSRAIPEERVNASALGPLLPHQRWVRVSEYEKTADFYSATEAWVRKAKTKVRVSYIREEPPSRYANEAAASYFRTVLEWAEEPGHSVSRLIGMPISDGKPDEDMLAWLREQAEIQRSVKTYDVKVLDWTVGSDLTNVCIVDDDVVFVTFSGIDSQSLAGELFEDDRTARNYRGFFDRWWNRATPLGRYLASVDRQK